MLKTFYIIICIFNRIIICNLQKKNLIIGAFKKYNWEIIKPFFISLLKANFQKYDCIMFVMEISQNTIEKLKSFGIIIYEFPDKYREMKINNVRYKLYEEYLRDNFDKYNMVLHVDVRDTFFQTDIFQLYKNQGSFIAFALEDGNIDQETNAIWMKNQYGKKIYEEIKNERIICSGTILGTIDKFYEFVVYIWEQILLKSPYNYDIHDQTATNFLIYHKKMFNECIIKIDNDYGPIMTVDLDKYKNFSFDLDENLLNFKGKKKVAIVHQYDRIPILIEIVKKKFIFQNDTNLSLIQLLIPKKADKVDQQKISLIFIMMFFSLICSLVLKIINNIFFISINN